MAKHSIYLDPYHEVLAKHLSKDGGLSKLIRDALDEHIRQTWNQIPESIWFPLISDLASRAAVININSIPLSQIKESVNKWLLEKKSLPKMNQSTH